MTSQELSRFDGWREQKWGCLHGCDAILEEIRLEQRYTR